MSKQRYPFMIEIYKGEGRMLFVPLIQHVGGNRIELGENSVIVDTNDEQKIGKVVLDILEKIGSVPLSEITPVELEANKAWKNNSRYKNWISFWKNNNYTFLKFYEDGHYIIYSMAHSNKRKGHYSESLEVIELLPPITVENIGKTIIKVFQTAEEYQKGNNNSKVKITNKLQMLNGKELECEVFQEPHFTDNGDCGAAEIYHCYSYAVGEEEIAEIFLGIAPELDCKLEYENVRDSWRNYYGETDCFEMKEVEYGIFKYRVEFRNRKRHKISYFLQQEEDLLLECGMEVYNPNRRKKTDEKFEKIFEEFTLKCKIIE